MFSIHKRLAATTVATATVAALMLATVVYAAGGNADCGTVRSPQEQPEVAIPMLTARLHVVNADGEPVPDAQITPSGLRTKVERGSHWSWIRDKHGELPVVKTDSSGMAEVQYPKFVNEQMETGEVTWSVDHEEYITYREDASVDLTIVKIELKRGRRIAVTAVDGGSATTISSRVFGELSGYGSSEEWKTMSNGMILSRAVDRERDHLRIIHIPEEGRIMFSDPVSLDSADEGLRKLLKDVPLYPGIRVTGRLDEQVPRPVTNGHIVAICSNVLQSDKRNSALRWNDWVPIEPDGSFVIDSVPRHSFVMLIAVCDDWVSTAPTPEDLTNAGVDPESVRRVSAQLVMPLVFRVDQEAIDCLLKMEQTAACQVTVIQPDGSPLPEATVGFWPNQYWPGFGTQIVGMGHQSAAALLLNDDERKLLREWWTSPEKREKLEQMGIWKTSFERYVVRTDANGVAVISNLPAGSDEQPHLTTFTVEHPEFEHPTSIDDRLNRHSRVSLVRGQTSEVTVSMNPQGTQIIAE